MALGGGVNAISVPQDHDMIMKIPSKDKKSSLSDDDHMTGRWSKATFGDIYEESKKLENLIKELEEASITNNTQDIKIKLARTKAEFASFLILQEKVLKQKARVKWLDEGDISASVRGIFAVRRAFLRLQNGPENSLRRKLSILKIKNKEGEWIEGTNDVASAVVQFFQKMFQADIVVEDSQILNVMKKVVIEADNATLIAMPSLQEVKDYVFSIDPDSAPGRDGLSVKFYQSAWKVISYYIHKEVGEFFNGATLPRFFSYTCLIMLPKVDSPQSFSDIRSISLCNVSIKIIAKIINSRLSLILPMIISLNQSGFIKGESTNENILLTQDIVNNISKPKKGLNLIIKLDMAKSYDRVSWSFLCFMLRQLGFVEVWIYMIYRFISNNRYSLIVNGSSGIKQTLKLALATLESYEKISGQMINKAKRCNAMAPKTAISTITRVSKIIGMRHGNFPMTYLGCPIYTGRKTLATFSDIVSEVINKTKGWHLKFLSTGGREVLIKHILLALNIHTLASVHPPKGSFELIETYLARFFWSRYANKEKHHWVAWKTLCFPFEEGGTGFRKLEDIYNAFHAKQWWKFRSTQSLWAQFMKAKYCNGSNPVLINQQKEDSVIWTRNNNGKFTISSAWNLLRQRKRVSSYDANIWQKGVPFKMSFTALRVVHNKVAIDERISSLGIIVDCRCSCCTSFSDIQGPKTTDHLFYSDQYAQQVWNFFIGRLGIEYRNSNLRT
nr:uncharacterized protein LOC108947345 [Nicotiana tomentosiformis]